MDQQELLHKGEGASPDQFTIVLVMHLDDADNLFQESSQFGSIVTDWHKARGAGAKAVVLIAVAEPQFQKVVKDWFEGIHSMDVTLRPIFEPVLFEMRLHNPDGVKVSEHQYPSGTRVSGGHMENLVASLWRGDA